ncbi:hypothetical protein IKF21_00730 [Candidatus Saccharibacteria bacterium]|nr:hypothetical protein [Candidatus Saccharibacteria bacterium]
MSRGAKTKISVVLVFLLICGAAIIALRAFAMGNISEILTYHLEHNQEHQYGQNIVVLDGSEDVTLDLHLSTRTDSRIYSVNGSFSRPENYDQPYYNSYFSVSSFQSGISNPSAHDEHDMDTGNYSFECNSTDECYNIEEDTNIYTMTYTVSRDTPVGVYNIPIHIDALQTLDSDGNFDIHEEDVYFEISFTVKRLSEITFWDENNNPITEITKQYNDEMFAVSKAVTVGDGTISDYYVESESGTELPVYILNGTDYIVINSTGDARVCASTYGSEYYIGVESCYTINIEKSPIMVQTVVIADKVYDGTTNAEVSEVYFTDKQLDESEYSITNVTLDNPNVGSRMASFNLALTELGNSRYTLINDVTSSPVMVHHATLDDITATIAPQTYDPSVDYQIIPITVTAMFNGEEITLEEGVDFELTYGGRKMYTEIGLTEADTYEIDISPKMDTSNYLFDSFSAEFTIKPIVVTVQDVQVDNKEYDGTDEAQISGVTLSDDKLEYGMDYDVSGTLDGVDVGTWNAETCVVLRNDNYRFYDNDEGTYSYYTFYDVPNVEIIPKVLTSENTHYDFSYRVFMYSGERIEPVIPLFATVREGYEAEELNFSSDYTIEYSEDTINVGSKYATIVGMGNFTGSLEPIEYYIAPSRPDNIEITTPDKVYTGEALEPVPIITAVLNGKNVTFLESDYEIYAHDDFINAGNYTYIIAETLGGNYHISDMESTFKILPYEISSSDISLSESVYKYNGVSQTPSVTVTVGNTTIDESDYDVTFSADTVGNDESDTVVTVTVKAKEGTNISGEATTTYTITPRDVLSIRGIEDNQRIEYTGSPVVLEGNVMVEENPGGIVAEDLNVQWFASDGATLIDHPINAGSYKVVYSYEDADYRGSLVANFEITKASSPSPVEVETDFKVPAGKTLADLEGVRTTGFAWTDSGAVVAQGNNVYTATYVYNGDSENYETLSLSIPVYGLAQVQVRTAESEGGKITVSSQEVLEGETFTVTILPEYGKVLDSIIVNGVDYTKRVDATTLSIVAGADDIDIVAKFTQLYYDVIEGADQTVVLGSDDAAVFRIDADYDLFMDGGAVYVDGALVGNANYTSWDGSTYIKLSKNYLGTLSLATHELKVAFNDGGIAVTAFTVAKSDAENHSNEDTDKNVAAPNTGFSTMVGSASVTTFGVMTIVLCLFVVLRKVRR